VLSRGIDALRDRQEWKFFAVLHRADLPLAIAWWSMLLLRALLPAGFAIAMGVLVNAVQHGLPLGTPLTLTAVVFFALQIVTPLHQAVSANLGDRTAAWLYDKLTDASVRPPGMGHLEDPELAQDLTTAREFDLGMHGPPLSLSLDFIAGGLADLLAGIASAIILFGYSWWAPFAVGGAWAATHWLLRESGVWRDRNTDEVRAARQTPNMPIASRSTRPRPRSCACSAWSAGSSIASSPGARAFTACNTRRPACAKGRCC
jgi:hypothetical protein